VLQRENVLIVICVNRGKLCIKLFDLAIKETAKKKKGEQQT
jgi:hypothetical protein